MNDLDDLTARLYKARRQTEELENDILKLKAEMTKPDRTPGPEDVGRWVRVRNGKDEPWRNTELLRRVDNDSTPFVTGSGCWKQARIIPGVGRVTMRPHDGSTDKPDWLFGDDVIIVELDNGLKLLVPANYNSWHRVQRYQKLELK